MSIDQQIQDIAARNIVEKNHSKSQYFQAIKELVAGRSAATDAQQHQLWQQAIDGVYRLS